MEVEIALEAPKRKWKVRNCQENPGERSLGSSLQASIFESSRLTSVHIGQRGGQLVNTKVYIEIHQFTDFEVVILKHLKKKFL